jgi:heme oxygenase
MKSAHPHSELQHLLRQATKRPHHVLDHHPVLAPLLRPDLSLIQYGNALQALHGVQSIMEASILAFLDQQPGLFDYRSRRKLPALEEDLAALGRERLPLDSEFPVLDSVAGLVGVLYTIEGSANGGQVIARLLRQLPYDNLPMAFFNGYGNLSWQRWDEFLEFAETRCRDEDREVAAASAALTFDAINRYMDAYLDYLGAHRAGT